MPEKLVPLPGTTCPKCGKPLDPFSNHGLCFGDRPTWFAIELERLGLVRRVPVNANSL